MKMYLWRVILTSSDTFEHPLIVAAPDRRAAIELYRQRGGVDVLPRTDFKAQRIRAALTVQAAKPCIVHDALL